MMHHALAKGAAAATAWAASAAPAAARVHDLIDLAGRVRAQWLALAANVPVPPMVGVEMPDRCAPSRGGDEPFYVLHVRDRAAGAWKDAAVLAALVTAPVLVAAWGRRGTAWSAAALAFGYVLLNVAAAYRGCIKHAHSVGTVEVWLRLAAMSPPGLVALWAAAWRLARPADAAATPAATKLDAAREAARDDEARALQERVGVVEGAVRDTQDAVRGTQGAVERLAEEVAGIAALLKAAAAPTPEPAAKRRSARRELTALA